MVTTRTGIGEVLALSGRACFLGLRGDDAAEGEGAPHQAHTRRPDGVELGPAQGLPKSPCPAAAAPGQAPARRHGQ